MSYGSHPGLYRSAGMRETDRGDLSGPPLAGRAPAPTRACHRRTACQFGVPLVFSARVLLPYYVAKSPFVRHGEWRAAYGR